MPTLPERNCSLLVRTDFTSDDAWQQVADEATRENADGFRAYAEPASLSFPVDGWVQIASVYAMLACPMRSLTIFGSMPASSAIVA